LLTQYSIGRPIPIRHTGALERQDFSVKTSTVALLIQEVEGSITLVDTLSNEAEIDLVDACIRADEADPLQYLYQLREQDMKKEDEFGDRVEEMLSQPFLNREVQMHGLKWLQSKMRIEEYHKTEKDAVKVIAEYAYKIFRQDPSKTDFFLASSSSQVRIRVFKLSIYCAGLSKLK
jgi:hypothetical protein